MSRLPTVAIIGRPNTGKSTLFNRMVGRRYAIESPVAGTTRDVIASRIEDDEVDYLLVDTGGIGGGSTDEELEEDVSKQSVVALSTADLIVFTINGQEELTSSDLTVVDMLRKKRRGHVPVILAITKCDNPAKAEARESEYRSLGIADDIVFLSAAHNVGVGELQEAIVSRLQELHFTKQEAQEENTPPRVAIIGVPNVGKSSLINALMSDPQRAVASRIVSDIPGTTRDSSDTLIRHDDKDYVFVDTAGLRRKSRIDDDIEYLSSMRTLQSVSDCDIAVLVLDAQQPVSKQEKRIARMAVDEGKGLILVVNKADMLKGDERNERRTEVEIALPYCRFAPILFTSAKTRENLPKIFALIELTERNRSRRIPMKDLRNWFESIAQRLPARELSRSKYITQAEGVPPTIVLFVKNPKNVNVSQLRALENSLRQSYAFEGTPIRFITKPSNPDEE